MITTVVLIAIAVGLLLSVVVAVRNARRNPRVDTVAAMRQLASDKSWSFSQPAGGDRVFVVAQDDWELVGLFFRGANRAAVASNHQTQWNAPYRGAAVVMLGPKLPRAVAQLDLGGPRVQSILKPLLGDRAALLAGTQRVTELGSDQFKRSFDVLATDRTAAEPVVGDGSAWIRLRQQLEAAPVVLIGNGAISIIVRHKMRTRQQAEALIDAGLVLLR